jgi:ribosomal-protein-alanine N-acetyltransferase
MTGETGDIRVRPATETDLAAVCAVEVESFPRPWSPGTFARLLERSDAELWVASGGEGSVVGHVVFWVAGDEGEVANIAVSPARRGAGLGGRLLDRALERMMDRRVAEVFLEVRASNRAAQRLYESRGFSRVGLRPGYYDRPREDAVIMRRALPRAPDRGP